MSGLTELLARVEGCKGPDREIDCAIAVALEGYYTKPHPGWPDDPTRTMYCKIDADGSRIEPGNASDMLVHEYTGSIDAALALVERMLPGWDYGMDRDQGEFIVTLTAAGASMAKGHQAEAATLPLAILTALLNALIARTPATGAAQDIRAKPL